MWRIRGVLSIGYFGNIRYLAPQYLCIHSFIFRTMKYTISTFCLCLYALFAFGQATKPQSGESVDVGLGYIPYAFGNGGGVNIDIKHYFKNGLGTGLIIVLGSGDAKKNFDLTLGKPTFSYAEMGWIIQYPVVNRPKFQVNLGITNGFSSPKLKDEAQKVLVHTRYGTHYDSKTVASNIYYLLQPRLELAYRLYRENPEKSGAGEVWLTARVNRNFLFGKSDFGTPSEFPQCSYFLGFMFKFLNRKSSK